MFKSLLNRILLLAILGIAATPSFVQAQADEALHRLFLPLTMEELPPHRTASGAPSSTYWQNETDYKIDVRLDTERHRIEGEVIITLTNNSPDELHFVWVLLEQNLFKPGSRGSLATPVDGSRFEGRGFEGGYELGTIRVFMNDETVESGGGIVPESHVRDTRMRVDLPEPLGANGGILRIQIPYAFDIPEYGADRMGRIELRDGWVYTIAQWYPNMAVYDMISGWNTRPYLGAGEFYRNFGTIEYSVTLPWNFILGGSGTLLNPEEVLTETQQNRLEQAIKSDTTQFIISPEEIGLPENRPVQSGELTWRYRMEQTRDVAWAASKGFIWDASGAEMPSGRRVAAMSLYPAESAGPEMWGRSTEYTRASIKHYSHMWMEYPWDTAINVAGIVGGMEYPGVSFCGYNRGGAALWGVTDHEFGHNWFPMIVGSNERKWFWMDEGLNTFIGHLSTLAFNDGEYLPWIRNMQQFVPIMRRDDVEPIMTHPDKIRPQNLGYVAYFKPAIGLLMLRNHVLGEEVFDDAFREYIRRWAFKHPGPADFFRTMNDATGENLDWFWRGWFYENYTIDQSVERVERLTDVSDSTVSTLVTVKNKGEMIMPVTLSIEFEDGETMRKHLPIEVFFRNREWTFEIRDSRQVVYVRTDPDHFLPDVNPGNNEWIGP
ncbi:MAG: M1 family metallopeptidase [Balneolales bacterium]|nr:M1 family metallopeptidase [Balneolales bacterium]